MRIVQQPSGIQPAMPAYAYKSYEIKAPLATHWNTVTCVDAGCEHHDLGWDSVIDERTDLGRRQAHYIRRESGRRFTEERQPDGLIRFSFEAGQRCFREHKTRNARPERYIERDGDYRGNPTGRRRTHAGAEDWVDSFATHQDHLKTLVERGLCGGCFTGSPSTPAPSTKQARITGSGPVSGPISARSRSSAG
jgi:hypothetical protein